MRVDRERARDPLGARAEPRDLGRRGTEICDRTTEGARVKFADEPPALVVAQPFTDPAGVERELASASQIDNCASV